MKKLINYPSHDIKCAAVNNLDDIIKAIPGLALEIFKILKELVTTNPDKYLVYTASMILTKVVKVISLDKSAYKQVHELLKIIVLNETQEFDKSLHTEAQTTLHKITHHLTQEYEKSKNPEVIEWFTESFNELPNISETRIFLKEICKSILKSGVINEYESRFILNCIKKYNFTFTVSVSKESGI